MSGANRAGKGRAGTVRAGDGRWIDAQVGGRSRARVLRRPGRLLGVALVAAACASASCSRGSEPERSQERSTERSTDRRSGNAGAGDTRPGGSSSPEGGQAGSRVPTAPPPVGLADLGVSLDAPIDLVTRPGDEGLWVAERAGVVRRMTRSGDAATVDDEVVLDITDEVGDTGGEKGLLGIAFDPEGEHLYASFTEESAGNSRVVRYPMDGNRAVAADSTVILALDQPFSNHNGGSIAFGPDGLLYLGFGDGGSADDPEGNGQRLDTLLGKVLRIDPSSPEGERAYSIPDDNPFAGRAEGESGEARPRPEIWASGLRNPWRFSFDTVTGDLWIGDVGQGAWEEIDRLPAGVGGANLGWDLREGSHAHESDSPDRTADGEKVELTEPVAEYGHDAGCSVTGGFVYRGSVISGLEGAYVFGDYCEARLRVLPAGGTEVAWLGPEVPGLASFGQGPDGELYALSISEGRGYLLVPG